MGVSVIAENTSIKVGASTKKPATTVIPANTVGLRTTWYETNSSVGRVNVQNHGYTPVSNLVPFVTFQGSAAESEVDVWVDDVLIYSVSGTSPSYTLYFNDIGGYSISANTKLEYRFITNAAAVSHIYCGYRDTDTGVNTNAPIVIQEFINSP